MIIVSQEKRVIINFDNINLIGTDGEGKIKIRLGTGDNAHLGAYDTEERAKEVLQEITIAYANITMMSMPKINIHEFIPAQEIIRNIVYQMPAE